MAEQNGSRFDKWSWLGMRLGGIFLLLLLVAHVFIQYLSNNAQPLPGASELQARWANPGWVALDGVLLVLAAAHAAGGVRQVALGRTRGQKAGRSLSILLVFSWLSVMALGIVALARGGQFLIR